MMFIKCCSHIQLHILSPNKSLFVGFKYFLLMQFCATRKGTQQAAGILVKEARFVMNTLHKQRLHQVANSLRDSKLKGRYFALCV